MKDLKNCLESSLARPDMFKRAKDIDEPFVKMALEAEGYNVTAATQDEDFKHIDLKVTNNNGETFNVDVKRNDENNAHSRNFLLTVVSRTGKQFPFNEKDYFAFINDDDKTISLVSHKDIEKLCKNYKEMSKYNSSKFILLPKNEVKKLGIIIDPANEIKNQLK